ncbi:beta-fructofuranosidase, insoluble isoenzyme CWINV3-like [Salvia miltiorrhiza]|uniref:beta-fructofuranosidase, insoluble isoenzyme CWINV3-like n=1 Tax=Salvia miltiorrhiza TaxID=226208 RepID=UPI0025ACCF64|nr:beta-fructofuranosidase, insoluble isoenzyme CWINV3-like [Salvia miltiorrhiza]
MYYNGVYHLFYQYNPYAAVWGNISWAHSVSYNLVDWIHLEPALNPTESYDINGCWSGSATLLAGEGKPLILYTGSDFLGHQVQNLAMPKDLSDQSRSSLQTPVKEAIFGSFLDVDPDQEISLRTLVDHSIVESFGGRGKSCITARVYPKLAISNNSHIYAFNYGAKSVAISSLVAWSMMRAQIAHFHTRRKSSIS